MRAALEALHHRIAADMAAGGAADCVVVYLGDYVDRGPDSAAVLDCLAAPAPAGWQRRFLRGNHEAAMLGFLAAPEANLAWLEFGGMETLGSYGVRLPRTGSLAERARQMAEDLARAVPAEHLAFLAGLEWSVDLGDYLFVHAGIRPGRPLARQKPEDLLTIREPFLSSRAWHGKVVVHGHSMTPRPELLANRIGVDTGAYAGGPLSCIILEGEAQRVITSDP